MWLGGAGLILAVILLPGAYRHHLDGLWGIVFLSLFAALFTYLVFRPASNRALYVLNNIFSTLGACGIALACYWTGGVHSGLFELLFFSAFYDAYFFRARHVLAHLLVNSLLALSPLLYESGRGGAQFPGHVATLLAGLWGISAFVYVHKSRLLAAEMRARRQALTDPLTGLCNVRGLEVHLEAAELHPGSAVLLVDVDRFKAVNSEYGHTGADRLLRQIGRQLAPLVGAHDCLARIGGDEFAIVLEQRTPQALRDLAASVSEAIGHAREAAQLDGSDLAASVGCALWPQDGASCGELLDAADRAMRACKERRGRAAAGEHPQPLPRRRPEGREAGPWRAALPTGGERRGRPSSRSDRLRARAIRATWWWRSRPIESLGVGVGWLGASAMTLIVMLLPQADTTHLTGVIALSCFGLAWAVGCVLLAAPSGSIVYPVSDGVGVVTLAVAVYLTGATGSPLLPVVFFGVAAGAYFGSPRAAAARLLAALLVCASPFAYAAPGDRVAYIVRFVAIASTATVLAGIIVYCRRQLANAERTARLLALQDPLTAVPNRRAFHRQLARAIRSARQDGGSLMAVAMIDLDNFKRVNDRHGHAAGDAVLQSIATALLGVVRESDYIARIGGDEFALIAPGANVSASHALGLRCVEAVERATRAAGYGDCGVSATIGYAVFPHHANTMDELQEAADAALMRAKDAGKRRVSCASAGGRSIPAAWSGRHARSGWVAPVRPPPGLRWPCAARSERHRRRLPPRRRRRVLILKSMLNQHEERGPELVFHALSDANRRRMIDQLTLGPASVSELAAPLGISLPAVVQHLHVLEASGLVQSAEDRARAHVRGPATGTQRGGAVDHRPPAGMGAEPRPPRCLSGAHATDHDSKEQAMSSAEEPARARSTVHASFVIERSYALAPQLVFDAWAQEEAKAQWFGPPQKPAGSYRLDFRVGGREHLAIAMPDGEDYSYDALYQDIVPGERILYSYDMLRGERASRCRWRRWRSRPTARARSCG